MKICSIQAIISLTLCSLAVAHTNYAQVLDKKVTLSLKEVSIEEALDAIENVTNVKFFYSVDQLDIKEKISFEAVDRSLRDLLDELLAPYQIKYKVHERRSTITLKRENDELESGDRGGNAEKVGVAEEYSVATITGRVTDAVTEQPMAGVNVIIKGTTEGTATDSEGNFSIWAEEKDVMVFSFIGYKTFETQVGGRSIIDVAMEGEVAALQEVVVNAGYYDVKAKEKTGNISKVSSKDIQKQPVSNPIAALQGRVTGLDIIQGTGVPGGNFQVRIRGTNSLANGNDPLYIINGVPYTSATMAFNETSSGILGNALNPKGGTSPLNYINPADIESIEVLKDADATAIYGSRGANGVILITTKKGQAGRTKVNLNFYTGVGKFNGDFDQLNTQQYLQMRKEAFSNDNVTPTTSNARDLLVWDTTRYTDWQKALLGGTAYTTDAQLSVSGGDVNTQFSFGGGYHKETTVFPGNNSDQRVSTHVSIANTTPDKKLKSSITVNYTANFTDLLGKDLTSNALFLPPNAPTLYDEGGNLNWDGWSSSGSLENPVAYLKRPYEAQTNSLFGSSEIGYSILPNLEVKSRFGYTHTRMEATNMVPLTSLSPSVVSFSSNTTYFSNNTFKNWIIEPQVNWKPKLGNGQFDLLIGTQFLDQTTEGLAQTASGFTSEALMKNITVAPNRTFGTNYYSQYRYHAIFGRINYKLNDKYIVNITGRRDGSSRFGPGKQFANFGAVGAAWIFSEEDFIQNSIPFLSFGKLRASYGTSGNDQLTDYEYLDAYTSSRNSYQGVIGLTPVRLSNPDFAWEINKKMEGSLVIGFIDNRIFASLTYYRNRSSNQLVGTPLPPTTGFNSIQSNFPATVENKGIEIEINTINIERSDFTWSSSLNLTIPRNKLLKFPNIESSPTYANTYVVGESLNISKLYHYTGIDTTGFNQFEDVNLDGSITVDDRQTVRFVGQDFYGGIANIISYKGFQLDFFFQFVNQTGRNYIFIKDAPGIMSNQPEFIYNKQWQEEGDNTDIQRFSQSSTGSSAFLNLKFSDRVVGDASFVRLKNISLSYTVPQRWIHKMHIDQARIYVLGQNLLTFSSYKGLDPETQGNFLPPLKVLTGGISLTF